MVYRGISYYVCRLYHMVETCKVSILKDVAFKHINPGRSDVPGQIHMDPKAGIAFCMIIRNLGSMMLRQEKVPA